MGRSKKPPPLWVSYTGAALLIASMIAFGVMVMVIAQAVIR